MDPTFVDPDPSEYERMVLSALQGARVHHMRAWNEALLLHKDHPTFHTEGWAVTREIGFTCSCRGGREETWRLPLTDFRSQLPESMTLFMGMRQAQFGYHEKRKEKETPSDKRAKALLHRYLTKEQRTSLRASKSFEVRGQNGKTYQITQGSCQNVYLMINGKRRVQYCIVPEGSRVPVYDLMLAQKVMLECDIKSFFAKANLCPMGGQTRTQRREWRQQLTLDEFNIPVALEDAHNPQRWAEERLAAVGVGHANRQET